MHRRVQAAVSGVFLGHLHQRNSCRQGSTLSRGEKEPTEEGAREAVAPIPSRRRFKAAADAPRPAGYVPIESRPVDDESLLFLHAGQAHAPPLDPGQIRAPELSQRAKTEPRYTSSDAARLKSTSVLAGQSLLNERAVGLEEASRLNIIKGGTRSLNVAAAAAYHPAVKVNELQSSIFGESGAPPPGDCAAPGPVGGAGSEKATFSQPSNNPAAASLHTAEFDAEEKPLLQQLEEDIRKLEYYDGTPEYPKQLEEFRRKYGDMDGKGNVLGERQYTEDELTQGLAAQPLDYLRSSSKLQSQLTRGPHGWDPVTIMQQQGLMRFQGYAFPPTQQLGKFNLTDWKGQQLPDSLKKTLDGNVDTHILNRIFGLDALQRRQMRLMLSDFDHGDRQTAFHVMMTYPYADWLHVFYMIAVGVALYRLQVKWKAYEFYDEYLGLDLRQVPRLERPLLAAVSATVMIFLLFQPLMLASIATTRAYRIFMRRPIGPP